jgi:preprotein translocase subunit SecA
MGMFDEMVASADDKKRAQLNKSYLEGLQKRVQRINELEDDIENLSDEELQSKTKEFRERLAKGEDINGNLLEEAFAVVREAAWRVLELRHYDVQLLGGLVLHDGRLAEMATGEGKTLVATLPAYLNGLMGKSYVITVNDYLARRDMEKMGQIHKFLGLGVGLIQSNMTEEQRQKAYQCNVIYVTNAELGFDYLRDHLALAPAQTVLPDNAFDGFCIVDEADSVLIDEARTPLIISKQVPAPANKYSTANELAGALKKNYHYTVDEKNKNIVLTEVGYRDSENALGIESLFAIGSDGEAWAPFVTNAVKAKELFTKDVDYTVLTNNSDEKVGVGIVDAFTGRVLDGRRWSDGLHQSIEAKEGIAVSEQSKVIAKVTYQNLFRQFTRLAGMTGTAMADAAELESIYGLQVTPVPTALPVARRDYPDVAFKTRKAADQALIKEVVNVGGGKPGGRPCLIGTTSVAQSEILVAALKEEGIEAELLNASPKNAPRESEIIAQAGRAGIVTVATNMAGRGTDILLGGCPKTMARIKTRSSLIEQGVISDEEAANLPPTPPESYFPCPLNDDIELALKTAASSIKKARGTDISAIDLDEILTVANDATEAEDDPDYVIQLREATEAINDLYSEVLNEEKEAVKARGGLYVMGTNRHESSRIDRQLRGRAGRQGDPGSSRFFLSFEDDMFVIFGGDAMKKMLEMFRVSEDMPVEAPQVTEALDKVQKAVEEKYREIRSEIFRFDETLNEQRKAIYARRQEILLAVPEKTIELMKTYNEETVQDIVKAQTSDNGDVKTDKVVEKLAQFFPGVEIDNMKGKDVSGIVSHASEIINKAFAKRVDEMEAAAKAAGRPAAPIARSANYLTLVTLDNAWSDHLQNMENLKEAVILRRYQGLDPITEYKNEAFALFEGLEDKMRFNAVYSLWQSLAPQAAPQAA